jgi:hypothetical protein
LPGTAIFLALVEDAVMVRSTLVYVRVSGGPYQDTNAQKLVLQEFIKARQFQNVVWLTDEIGSSKRRRPGLPHGWWTLS